MGESDSSQISTDDVGYHLDYLLNDLSYFYVTIE